MEGEGDAKAVLREVCEAYRQKWGFYFGEGLASERPFYSKNPNFHEINGTQEIDQITKKCSGKPIINWLRANTNMRLLNDHVVAIREPFIKSSGGLWIPSSGIIDSHGVMQKLEYLTKNNNATIRGIYGDAYILTFTKIDDILASLRYIHSFWEDAFL